jgi:hypothetical protein
VTLRAGDLVEVRSRDEILATLQRDGSVDRMPFMPEMLRHCGKRYRVSKVAHKTCDTAKRTGGRSLEDCFHLEDLRCDGSAHAGCQATCLFFWKGAWLKKVGAADAAPKPVGLCTEFDLQASTLVKTAPGEPVRYSCQATQLFDASQPLRWWVPTQYVRDVSCGNWSFGQAVRVLSLSWFRVLLRRGVGYRFIARLYRSFHQALMGHPPALEPGVLPKGAKTPTVELNLLPGEWVRVRPYDEIRQTLNVESKNRGLWFDQEMVPACKGRYQVSGRVDRILDENTGAMIEMKTACIVLKNVNCTGRYTQDRLLCPRAVTTYWREAWLQREEAHYDRAAKAGAAGEFPPNCDTRNTAG